MKFHRKIKKIFISLENLHSLKAFSKMHYTLFYFILIMNALISNSADIQGKTLFAFFYSIYFYLFLQHKLQNLSVCKAKPIKVYMSLDSECPEKLCLIETTEKFIE